MTGITIAAFLVLFTLDVDSESLPYTSVQATIGQSSVRLPCNVDYTADLVVRWISQHGDQLTYNNTTTTDDKRFSVSHPYQAEWYLVINKVEQKDAGNYSCLAKSTRGDRVFTVELLIQRPPYIIDQSPDVVVKPGSDVTVSCSASGVPTPTITWYHESFINVHNMPKHVGVGNTYEIKAISYGQAGIYECIADNDVRPPTTAKIRVNVLFSPVLTMPYQEVRQQNGLDTLLECFIQSNPNSANPVFEHWWQTPDSTTISKATQQSGDRLTVHLRQLTEYTAVSALLVRRMEDRDFGRYLCQATNEEGARPAQADVTVAKVGDSELGGQCMDVADVSGTVTVLAAVISVIIVLYTAVVLGLITYYRRQLTQAGSNQPVTLRVRVNNVDGVEVDKGCSMTMTPLPQL